VSLARRLGIYKVSLGRSFHDMYGLFLPILAASPAVPGGTGKVLDGRPDVSRSTPIRSAARREPATDGPSRRTESAVLMGLVWLKNHQNPDGMWSTDRFLTNCMKGSCSGAGAGPQYDVGNTGLALLAFLGGGHTHKHGKFKRTVKNALKALKDRQSPEGRFGPETSDGRWIYGHLIATAAFCEAYGLSNQTPLLHGITQKAVDYAVGCQNPYAGWRYGRRPGENDTSCTSWAIMALKVAKLSGLAVPREAFQGGRRWLDMATDPDTFRTGYVMTGDSGSRPENRREFQPLEAMTAAAVTCRVMTGSRSSDPLVSGGASLLNNCLPRWDASAGTIEMYYWYYGTLAAFQVGGDLWSRWNSAVKRALLPTQRRKGCENGSWDPLGPWGSAGGRVYSTSICTLTLETYYRYRRIK
jgi:hypothetical protein